MKHLSIMTALMAVGSLAADNVASRELARVDRAVNANVCDNYDDVDGEFDVVGIDEETGLPVLGARGGRGGGGRGGQHRFSQGGGRGQPSRGTGVHRGAGGGHPGARPGRGGGGFPGLPPSAHAPSWMTGAWGVNPPNEMLHVLPLIPQSNAGIFTVTVTSIQYLTRPQKPFRGERLLSTTTNTGASAPGVSIQSTAIFVGVDLQQVESGNIPIATWAATAFGVRLAMVDALPGIEISIPCVSVGTLADTDTVAVTLVLLGRVLA